MVAGVRTEERAERAKAEPDGEWAVCVGSYRRASGTTKGEATEERRWSETAWHGGSFVANQFTDRCGAEAKRDRA